MRKLWKSRVLVVDAMGATSTADGSETGSVADGSSANSVDTSSPVHSSEESLIQALAGRWQTIEGTLYFTGASCLHITQQMQYSGHGYGNLDDGLVRIQVLPTDPALLLSLDLPEGCPTTEIQSASERTKHERSYLYLVEERGHNGRVL